MIFQIHTIILVGTICAIMVSIISSMFIIPIIPVFL